MVAVLKKDICEEDILKVMDTLKEYGVVVHRCDGDANTVLVLVGDTSHIDTDIISVNPLVEKVVRISEPFKYADRKLHPFDTVIDINGNKIGGGSFLSIAGPCSVESREQICSIAREVKAAGAQLLRGGAFKPRTSPYSFQGMREEGIKLLLKAKEETGMPVVTEIMDISHLPLFENVDVIQVGARNMQNYELLKELGRTRKPILLKRGLSSTIQELLMGAEYIMSGGNDKVILCERGIRTFENSTRNTMDISAIALLKEKTHLPVIADPSHAGGISKIVKPLSLAAAAAGSDGVMIEVHNDPTHALCDGPQAVTPDEFSDIICKIHAVRNALKQA